MYQLAPGWAAQRDSPGCVGQSRAMSASPSRRVLARSFEALLTLWLLATLCFVLLRAARLLHLPSPLRPLITAAGPFDKGTKSDQP